MPRKHKRIDGAPPLRPPGLSADAPEWAQADGYEVRTVAGSKPYRCPGCDHEIRPGVSHLVVIPRENSDERRHWHTECWRRELRRLGI